MSWSMKATGNPALVAAEIERQFAGIDRLPNPEEDVKRAARVLVAAALQAQHQASIVEVVVSGHQDSFTTGTDPNKQNGFTNTLSITVTPKP